VARRKYGSPRLTTPGYGKAGLPADYQLMCLSCSDPGESTGRFGEIQTIAVRVRRTEPVGEITLLPSAKVRPNSATRKLLHLSTGHQVDTPRQFVPQNEGRLDLAASILLRIAPADGQISCS